MGFSRFIVWNSNLRPFHLDIEIIFLIGDHFLDYFLVESFLLLLLEFVKEDDLILFIE